MHTVFRFGDLETSILEQHEQLRARLHGMKRSAARADLPWARDALQTLLLRFAALFDAHLDFEERELAPWIRKARGSAADAALFAEHREQRCRLEQVCALADDPTGGDTTRLFEEVSKLAESLLEDMLDEECALHELVRVEHVDDQLGRVG